MDALRKFWQLWKRFGEFMGNIFARVVLTVFYFTLYAPFGLGVRLFGDPLATGKNRPTGWVTRETTDLGLDDAHRLS